MFLLTEGTSDVITKFIFLSCSVSILKVNSPFSKREHRTSGLADKHFGQSMRNALSEKLTILYEHEFCLEKYQHRYN